ncbi:helix-turn-helix transcriptional regulator [Priestia megaterium]
MLEKTTNVSIGMELRLKRTEMRKSLREVAEAVRVSENFLSMVERDKKVPSDCVIKALAKYYMLEEAYLFERFDRIPIVVAEEIKDHKLLHETLYDISTNDKLSEDVKKKLYEDIQQLYLETLKRED